MITEYNSFSFAEVGLGVIKEEIGKLNNKKATTFRNIPAKHLKETEEIVSPIIHSLYNGSIRNSKFPYNLKLPDVSPIFKKDDATIAKNYRPVSVLPTVSKIFERLMHSQLSTYFERYLSPHMCGYRKGYNAQNALVALIENGKNA